MNSVQSQTQSLIPTFTGSLNGEEQTLVNARDLHEFLRIDTPFHIWIARRISEYGFTQVVDFIGVNKIVRTEAGFFGRREKTVTDYHLSIDMAKELAMIERNERGRQVRRYFIEMEKQARQAFVLTPNILPNRANTDALWLIDELQDEFLKAHPDMLGILRYFNLGLKHVEIAKLTEMSTTTVRERLKKLTRLGLADYRPNEKASQAASAANRLRHEKRVFLAKQAGLGLEG